MTRKQILETMVEEWRTKRDQATDEEKIKWCNYMIITIQEMIKEEKHAQ